MPDSIKSGDSGNIAKVNDENRLSVDSISRPIQNKVSINDGQAYQARTLVSLGSGTTPVLTITNTSDTKKLTFTFIRHQVVGATGGTAFPNTSNYLRVSHGRTASGGSAVTPVNMQIGSGNNAAATVLSNPTMSGTAVEFDRWYTQSDGDMNTWNKEGALVLNFNETLELSYVGDHTGGDIEIRASFIFETV